MNKPAEIADHIFICEGWHLYNDLFPFYRILSRRCKYLFTDVSNNHENFHYQLSDLNTFSPTNRRAIIYLSFPKHYHEYVLNGPLNYYSRKKIVRLYHGIVGPWAHILRSQHDYIDVVVAASELDAETWRRYSNCRVEIIGWPKGEMWYRQIRKESPSQNSIVVASSWAAEKSAFRICDHLAGLNDYDITFMIHPLLFAGNNSKRKVDGRYVASQLAKMNYPHIRIVDCRDGVIPHMKDKGLLLGVTSSSSYEWLLFDRPAIFLTEAASLDYGPLFDFARDHRLQIQQAFHPAEIHVEKRTELRRKLMSHMDDRYSERFHNLIQQLESELINDSPS
jgi:hypothetical protein